MNVQTAVSENPYIYLVSKRLNTDGARVVTYSELIAENSFQNELDRQIIGSDGEVIDVSKLDTIDPRKMEFYTVKFSPNVERGIRYMQSCFDTVDDGKYNKLTAAEDFSGMSASEIYKAIYKKYQSCYGENFYYSDAINYPIPPSEYDDYYRVIRRFNKEVTAALGDTKNVQEARREALYGDMSDYEVRQAIIDEYDLSDGLTFRELYQMTYDMWKVGLDGGFHNRLDDLFYDFGTAESRANCDNIAAREKYLDKKVTGYYFDQMEKFYNCPGTQILPDYYTTLCQITDALKK